jgi:ATP-dependent RNA helicase DDX47/RRP3
VDTLRQEYLFMPFTYKDCYLAYVCSEFAGSSAIIFCCTCSNAQRIAIMLRTLGFGAIPIHGKMSQSKRVASLNKFKAGQRSILVATDVASRGLDIPRYHSHAPRSRLLFSPPPPPPPPLPRCSVDLVINFEIPRNSKDYVHRVGRTARAGRSGRAVTFVSQYDVELYQRIEALLGKKLPAFAAEQDTVLMLLQRVQEAQRIAIRELKDQDFDGKTVDASAALEAEVRVLRLGVTFEYSSVDVLNSFAGCCGCEYKAKEQAAGPQGRQREEEATWWRRRWRQKIQAALDEHQKQRRIV